MKKLVIVYYQVYNIESKELTIGGIQTYIFGLITGLQKRYDLSVLQLGQPGSLKVDNITVRQFLRYREIIDYINSQLDVDDIVLWGTENLASKLKVKSVSIQHGVAFDYFPREKQLPRFLEFLNLQFVYRHFQQMNSLRWIDRVDNAVCVDYNYVNWYRTKRLDSEKLIVIPNYAPELKRSYRNTEGRLKVLFARRFVKKRGTDILINLCLLCKERGLNIDFTLAGEGPEELHLRDRLKDYDNVRFTKFDNNKMANVYSAHHISLIPTVASEGTSFSLLESLSFGSVVIASNVGGMTNLIINAYNGFLCNPSAESFFKILAELDENREILNRISLKGYEVAEVLGKDRWIKDWVEVLEKI